MLIYEPPAAVKKKVEQLKQPGESIYIQPLEFRLLGGSYFWVRYDQGEDCWFLIIDKEGATPRKDKKVEDLLIAGLNVGSAYNDLSFNKKVARKKHDLTLKKYIPLFQEIKGYFRQENAVVLEDFRQLENLIHTVIDLQPKVREGMQKTGELGDILQKNRYITDELYEQFQEFHYSTAKYGFLQGYEQVKSYSARKKVISYLFQSGKISWAIKLWFLHINFWSDNLGPEQQKGFDKLYRVFIEGKQSEEEEYMLRHCRNPE